MDKINGWGEGGETVKLATSDRQAKWREQMRKTPSSRKHLFPLNAAIFRVLKIKKKKKKMDNGRQKWHHIPFFERANKYFDDLFLLDTDFFQCYRAGPEEKKKNLNN